MTHNYDSGALASEVDAAGSLKTTGTVGRSREMGVSTKTEIGRWCLVAAALAAVTILVIVLWPVTSKHTLIPYIPQLRIAIRTYHEDHGSWPESLDDLRRNNLLGATWGGQEESLRLIHMKSSDGEATYVLEAETKALFNRIRSRTSTFKVPAELHGVRR